MGVLKVASADKFDEFVQNPEGKAVRPVEIRL